MTAPQTYECPFCYYARIVVVAVFAVFLAWFLMTDWFTSTCTGVCASVVSVLVMPASLIASSISGDSDEVIGTYFSIGMIFQLLGVYLLVNKYVEKKRKSKADS